jgi:aminopeptidase N
MKKTSFAAIVILFLFSACSIIGYNSSRKTPAREGKYPKFTKADTLRGSYGTYRKNNDVYYYSLDLVIDIEQKSLSGKVDMYFTALDNIDTIQIDLYDNMNINEITYKNTTLEYYRNFNAVFVKLNQTIKNGEQFKITVDYSGTPQKAKRPPWEGGFVWKRDKNKNPWISVSCELDGASLWWPVKDHLFDEPDSLSFSMTIPDGLFCVSNGRLREKAFVDGKQKFTWHTSYSINTYNVSFYIGDFQHFTLPYYAADTTYLLDFYVLPYNLEKAKTHFGQAVTTIRTFEEAFGEYPWWRDGYKLVESPFQGMEHQTAIAYGDEFKNSAYLYDFDYIIIHETAHEWWGNSVSASDYAEIWLHEGFATYSEAVFVEQNWGYPEYLEYIEFETRLVRNKRPLIGPFDVNYWKYKDGDPYTKGAALLHTLRNAIGDYELFYDILREYYSRNKYSITTSGDFISLVNEMTGENYQWFFDVYLYSRISPQLEWSYIKNKKNNTWEFKYKWANVGKDFKLPIEIMANEELIDLYPTDTVQTLILYDGGSIFINPRYSYFSILENIKL